MDTQEKKKTGLIALAIAAVVGGYYFFKPKTANAMPNTPSMNNPTVQLPGTNLTIPIVAPVASPAQVSALQSNDTFQITTNDPPPAGNLNVRDNPIVNNVLGNLVGQVAKNAIVKKTDGPQAGWVKIMGNDVNSGASIQGWVDGVYLIPASGV